MSSSIKARTVDGTATSATQEKLHDDYEQYAKSRMLLSFVQSLREATYLICGLLVLLMIYSWACERDLADQEFNRSHQTTFKERSSVCSGNCSNG